MPSYSELPRSRMPALLGAVDYALWPRRFALRNHAAYGKTYRIKAPAGEAVLTSDPEHVRRVFAGDSETFDSLASESLGWLFGARSVLITQGSTHRRQRKLLSPPLTGARLRAFGQTMQALAEQRVGSLQPGSTFRALDLATDFTLDVILQTVFGVVGHDQESRDLRSLLKTMVHDIPAVAIFAEALRTPLYPAWSRYTRTHARFDAWLRDKIRARRARADEGEDVLSLLLSARYDDGSPMEDDEIRDQLITLLLAGHETTSLALASCLGQVHRHPDVLARLREELQAAGTSPEDVQRLPFLSAVIDETLRIDPIVTDVARIARKEVALDDALVLRRGQVVLILIEALHQDPALYPEPQVFRPERFLTRRFAPHEYVPFGGGVRRCLGAAFSDYETKILLSTLLRQKTLALVSARPEPRVRRNITMGPKHGVPLRVLGSTR